MRFPWVKVSDEDAAKTFEDKTVAGPYDNQYVVLKNVDKIYDNKFHAVHDFNLVVKKNEFVVFVGPSGCGKSTTLRMIAGLEDISKGELYINGEYANDLLSKDRDIAMVFQNYALYPNMSVYKNMAFALQIRKFPRYVIDKNGEHIKVVDKEAIRELKQKIKSYKLANNAEEIEKCLFKIEELKANPSADKIVYTHLNKAKIQERVNEAARILEIEDQLTKKPKELSGGQRQRVALGRAIVRNARIFLMDEPLSNLDAKLRVQMRSEIIRLHKKLKATTIYVTHDQTEAMTMADRIVVMKLGFVQQIGTPIEIYRKPANLFVASFIGSPAMNLIKGTYKDGVITFPGGDKFKLSEEQIKRHDVFYREKFVEESRILPEYLEKLEQELKDFNAKKHSTKDEEEFNAKYEDLKSKKTDLVKRLDDATHGKEHEIIFGIRPEDITQCEAKDKDAMNVEIRLSELLGDQYYLHFDFGGKDVLSKVLTDDILKAGEKINLKINKEKVHLFDVDSEMRI